MFRSPLLHQSTKKAGLSEPGLFMPLKTSLANAQQAIGDAHAESARGKSIARLTGESGCRRQELELIAAADSETPRDPVVGHDTRRVRKITAGANRVGIVDPDPAHQKLGADP